MSRRRRTTRRYLAGPDGDLFLDCDGVTPLLDADLGDCYENKLLARAAWRQARAATWGHVHRASMWPPFAAIVFDGITEATRATRPTRWDTDWSAAAVQAAVALDVASVAAFRVADPAGAAEITDHLELYTRDLRTLLALARDLGGNPRVVAHAWGQHEVFALRHPTRP